MKFLHSVHVWANSTDFHLQVRTMHNTCEFHLFLLNSFFMASFAITLDYFAASQLLCSPSRKYSKFGNSILTVRSPFHGCLPKFNLNGEYPVTTCFLLLYWNSAADNCYGTLNTNNFYFIFFYFSWFYFSFLFYFPGKTMKQACDREVTGQVTWCDVIGLESGRRI